MAAPIAASPENFYHDYSNADEMQWSIVLGLMKDDLLNHDPYPATNVQETYNAPQDERNWMNCLPIGMRFRPTDQELIEDYLKSRVLGYRLPVSGIINEANIYAHEPQTLKDFAYCHDDGRMYFFTPLKRKDNSKTKLERVINNGKSGFWKATQKKMDVFDKNRVIIGTKASLTHNTFAINGKKGERMAKKEDWLMTEYRLPERFYQEHNELVSKEEIALCAIYLTQRGKNN